MTIGLRSVSTVESLQMSSGTRTPTTTTFWWDQHLERIEKCEADNKILKGEVERLSQMVEILIGKVRDLEATG